MSVGRIQKRMNLEDVFGVRLSSIYYLYILKSDTEGVITLFTCQPLDNNKFYPRCSSLGQDYPSECFGIVSEGLL